MKSKNEDEDSNSSDSNKSPSKDEKGNEDSTKRKKTVHEKIKEFFSSKSQKGKELNLKSLDEDRTIEQIIESKGYKVEKHTVKTVDGYTLVIFRIPGGKHCKDANKCPPILFQHGVIDSSDGWVCNGEEQSIPFVLANLDYDIWLANSRGNKYCKEHDKYKADSYEFWQFSFHELAIYDVPAVIDYIKTVNKSGEKIIYFGHSQGTALLFAGLAEKFEYYKENLKLFVALAPVARLSNVSSSILNFFSSISIEKLISKMKVYEIGQNTEGGKKFYDFIETHAKGLPNFVLHFISDDNSKEINNPVSINVYMKHYPSGSSLKCFKHFVQIIKSGKFIKFDYKKEANYFIYGQIEPPEYDLSVIKDFPIMLIGGEVDKLASPEDVKWLKKALGNNVIYYNIEPKMGHISFMCAKDFSWFTKPLNIILKDFGHFSGYSKES